MATNAISAKLLDAANVTLSGPVRVHGMNEYVISSDFISWNDMHNHTISDIAADFGQRTAGVGDKIFTCGDDKISVYDFGLLYTVFTAMATAQAELGGGFPIEESATQRDDVHVLWLGNDIIIYSPTNNLILPIDNADVESACSGKRIECGNFCNKDKYLVDRERIEFFVTDAQKKELFCRFRICTGTQKSYAQYFEQPKDQSKDLLATWDTESTLGKLIASATSKLPTKDAFKKYKKKGMVESVNKRADLFIQPSRTYDSLTNPEDLKKFFGSICYTDKAEAIVAVNYHAGMLVYSPCFPGDNFEGLMIDATPHFDKFYDVTSECEGLMRFANTVNARPLTPAQFDVKVYNRIADALLNSKLSRLAFSSCLGKVVIPESVLEAAFDDGFGADLFCIVPVGTVGEIVVCMTAAGKLEATYPRGWSVDEAFYDITEVLLNVEH